MNEPRLRMRQMARAPGALLALALLVVGCHREDSTTAGAASGATAAPENGSSMSSPFDPKRPPDRMAPPEEQFGAKEWAKAADYRMRFTEVRKCEVESYFAPKPGHIKLGVQLELEALSASEVPSNQLHAVLLDAEGTRYAPTLAGCTPSLPTLRLTRGHTASGFVTFEIPESSHGLVLRYEPLVLGRADSSLAFALGR